MAIRVVVNQWPALRLKAGIGHYTAQLLRCLSGQAGGDQIDVYPDGRLARCLQYAGRFVPQNSGGGQGPPAPAAAPYRLGKVRRQLLTHLRQKSRIALSWHFHVACPRSRHDLYHEPNFIPLPSDLPTVATLHDLSVLLHPEWHPADRVVHFERNFQCGMRQCGHYIAISEAGRQEMIHRLGIAPERITRTYMGIRPNLGQLPAAEVAAVLRRLNLPSQYLLNLGTIEPRKNILLLLRAYCSLPAALRERWPLLLVGSWGWNTAAIADYYHREARHRGVVHLGYVPEEYLPAIYNGARALVFPSLYEGFGLPPLEMMACGGAVLASTADALVEILGGRACLIDPHNLDGWRDALTRVCTDDDWWQSLRRGVQEVARPFTWERCAADTLGVYRKLCGVAHGPSESAQEEAHHGRAA